MNKRLPFLFLMLALVSQSASALDPDRKITQYILDSWTTEQGIIQSTIYTILQTRDGYIWIGTQEGLMKFDGVQFTIFNKPYPHGPGSSVITDLLEDRNGVLWIGTWGHGVSRFDSGKFSHVPIAAGDSNIADIYEDNSGIIWFGTSAGLASWQNGKMSLEKNSAIQGGVSPVTGTSAELWLGTSKGLIRKRNSTYEKVFDSSKIPPIYSLYKSSVDDLWIGTSKDARRFHNQQLTTYPVGNGDFPVMGFCQDQSGNFWIATQGDGLKRLKNNKMESLTTADGLLSNEVLSLMEDWEGSLWIGTSAGLHRLRNGKFLPMGEKEGLSNDVVWTVFEDHKQNLWIGTDEGGLNLLSNGTIRTFLEVNGLTSNRISALYEDMDGNLWIGTIGRGVNILKDNTIRSMLKEQLANEIVNTFYQDRDGAIWIGTSGKGLYRIANGKIDNFTMQEGLPSNAIRCILQTKDGRLWIGTELGLTYFESGRFTNVISKALPEGTIIFHIYEDRDQTLWIATLGSGLLQYQNGNFRSFRAEDGLYDDKIFVVLEDDSANLWMSSNRGIFRCEKKTLRDFASNKINRISCDVFDKSDGMRSEECNGGYYPAGWKSKSGKLWFPTVRGIVGIDPLKMNQNKTVPPVYVTGIIADNQSLPNTETRFEFNPGIKRFEFHYTALSFEAPEKMNFRYKLEGFDRNWVSSGSRRVAYYTNLPPGKYRFQVIASNNDGVWNEKGTSITLILNPYFYQTGWFVLLCATAIIGIAYAVHSYRLRLVRKRFEIILNERNRIARELHDTVAQNVSAVVVQLEAARDLFSQEPQQAKQFLDQAQTLARESVDQARTALMELRDDRIESDNFISTLERSVHRLIPDTVEFKFQMQGVPPHLSTTEKHQILRICEEAVRNAIAHAQPHKIGIDVLSSETELILKIVDDGTGFDPTAKIDGHYGISGMRERAAQIGAELIIRTEPATGTEVRLKIPRHKI